MTALRHADQPCSPIAIPLSNGRIALFVPAGADDDVFEQTVADLVGDHPESWEVTSVDSYVDGYERWLLERNGLVTKLV